MLHVTGRTLPHPCIAFKPFAQPAQPVSRLLTKSLWSAAARSSATPLWLRVEHLLPLRTTAAVESGVAEDLAAALHNRGAGASATLSTAAQPVFRLALLTLIARIGTNSAASRRLLPSVFRLLPSAFVHQWQGATPGNGTMPDRPGGVKKRQVPRYPGRGLRGGHGTAPPSPPLRYRSSAGPALE